MSIEKNKITSDIEIHLFVCTNSRTSKNKSCGGSGSDMIFRYLKDRMRSLSENYGKRIKVNSSSCLSNCANGPVIAVYPEGNWYQVKSNKDVDKLVIGMEKAWIKELRNQKAG